MGNQSPPFFVFSSCYIYIASDMTYSRISVLKERKTIVYASVTKFSAPIHKEIHDHQQRDSAFGSLELNMLPKYHV